MMDLVNKSIPLAQEAMVAHPLFPLFDTRTLPLASLPSSTAVPVKAPTVWSSRMRTDSQIIMSEGYTLHHRSLLRPQPLRNFHPPPSLVTEAQSAFDNIIASQNALRKDDVFFGEMMQKMFVDAPDVTSRWCLRR